MPDYILIQDPDGAWQRAAESALPDEATLQRLLRDHPEVLPLDHLGSNVPPLLVVGRETALATGYADVVAVDPAGLVTIIEAKLDRNPEVKRKVVAQVLGYAASLWGYEYEQFELDVARKYFAGPDCQTPELRGMSLGDAMTRFIEGRGLSDGWDQRQFRDNLAANLRAGRFRLVIVVDKVNDELRRIVEYLNASTQPSFQILCAELRYFATANARLLVPTLIGAPSASAVAAAKRNSHQWDEGSFLAEIERSQGRASRDVAGRLLDWAKKSVDRISWGMAPGGAFTARLIFKADVGPTLFSVYPSGKVEFSFGYLSTYPPYNERAKRAALRDQLMAISGVTIPEDKVDTFPYCWLDTLASPIEFTQFASVMTEVATELRQNRALWLSQSGK